MTNLSRYALLLDPKAVRTVDRLQRTYELKNKAEVYDLAVRVLTWVTEQQINGYEVGRSKGEHFQPLLLPFTLDTQAWSAEPAEATV